MMKLSRTALAISLLACIGCGSDAAPQAPSTHRDEPAHGHSHERNKLLLADAGPHHAGLTSHLSSKTGNELDILIETADDEHKPVPLPLERITAQARTTDGKEHSLDFLPTEPGERPGDPPGKCSRFTAKAAWMAPSDSLEVTATIEVEGKPRKVRWKDFNPKKYAHFEE